MTQEQIIAVIEAAVKNNPTLLNSSFKITAPNRGNERSLKMTNTEMMRIVLKIWEATTPEEFKQIQTSTRCRVGGFSIRLKKRTGETVISHKEMTTAVIRPSMRADFIYYSRPIEVDCYSYFGSGSGSIRFEGKKRILKKYSRFVKESQGNGFLRWSALPSLLLHLEGVGETHHKYYPGGSRTIKV